MATPLYNRSGPRELLVCFSHLRWNFVYQRPQHLMARFARHYDVVFFEEAVHDCTDPRLEVREVAAGLQVMVPHVPASCAATEATIKAMLEAYIRTGERDPSILWYYTPMSVPLSEQLARRLVVYDCMDELSAFRGAPPQMLQRERRLMHMADIVFTGGLSLYQAKRKLHPDVHAFCSSVDTEHFSQARSAIDQPADQAAIASPRLGFHGVIDERMDLQLVEAVARLRPDWQLVFIGPVVKIDPTDLPRLPNIHYLGPKQYDELPAYLAGWDVAIMPFALNESTRFISPTKTPEYLAGGRAVVSTPVTDVVRSYGKNPAVHIAGDAAGFVAAVTKARSMPAITVARHADSALKDMSWDRTWGQMHALMQQALARPLRRPQPTRQAATQKRVYDVLVVGAGFAGSVMAERLAAGSGKRVLVVDRRPHIGGNAYDCVDEAGILIHKYGPHIFHTNADAVVQYLSRFTSWRPDEHRVLAQIADQRVPIPINLTTLETLYGRSFTEQQATDFLRERAEPISEIRSAQDVVLSSVGRELYELFFRGYTLKQWGMDPACLDKSVTARIPTRCNRDDRYFTDSFQAMPLHGYTKMFERMLDHPNIDIRVGSDFQAIRHEVEFKHLVYTGPLDEYFGHVHGQLPYRSLRFEHVTKDTAQFQPVAVVNFPSPEVPYTRITEYRHLTGQLATHTSLTYEYPSAEGDPYYPIPCPESDVMRQKYEALADAETGVTFLGRLGTYRYYNMDQVVAQALAEYARLEGKAGIREALEAGITDAPVARIA